MDITEKELMQIAGWECIKKGKLLVAANSVKKVQITKDDSIPLTVTGLVIEKRKKYVCGLKFKSLEDVENLCRCSASIRFGKVCEHSIALLLSGLGKDDEGNLVNDKKFSASNDLDEQKTSTICPVIEFQFNEHAEFIVVGVRFEKRDSRLFLKTNDVDKIFGIKILENINGTLPIGLEQLFDLFEISKKKSIEVLESETGERSNLIIEDVNAKIPVILSEINRNEIAIRRTALPKHILLKNNGLGWLVNFNSMVSMEVNDGWTNEIDGVSLKPLFESLATPDDIKVSFDWLNRNYFQIIEFLRIELSGELTSKIRILAEEPEICLKIEGSLNSISVVIKFKHRIHPNLNLFAENQFIQNLGIKSIGTNVSIIESNEEDCIERTFNGMINGSENVLMFYCGKLTELMSDNAIDIDIGERFYSLIKKVNIVRPKVEITSHGTDWFEFGVNFVTEEGYSLSEEEVRQLINQGRSSKQNHSSNQIIVDYESANDLFESLSLSETEQVIHDNKTVRRVIGKEALYIRDNFLKHGLKGVDFKNPFNESFEELFIGSLKEYQRSGVIWMNERISMGCGFILADEMGLGKTVQVLALLATLNDAIENVLIVCPTSLIHNWRKEFEKFLPQLNVYIHHGNKRNSLEVKNGIIITSYATLLNDLHNFKTKGFSLIVADEASYFKNDSTKTFKALESLRANYKVAVTGTPIENDLSDLWSLMNVVNPNYLGSKESFKEKFGKLKYDDTLSQSLNKRVSPFILRRLKSDVLTELPDKVERVIYCELSRSERSFYNELLISGRDLISNLINANESYDTLQVLTLLLRLRQASCDLRLITKSDKKDFISSKMNLLKTIIRNNLQNGSKIIVFSQFVKMLKLIEGELASDGIQSYLLSGSSKIDDRNSMVTSFQDTNNEVMVFLVSLKAGGYGLNLTAADTVVHFDPWWNPAVENQATDRVHRIGQNRVVNCIKLIAANTVEEKILSLQDKKRSLINLAIDEQNPVMSGLSKDDLKFVLE